MQKSPVYARMKPAEALQKSDFFPFFLKRLPFSIFETGNDSKKNWRHFQNYLTCLADLSNVLCYPLLLVMGFCFHFVHFLMQSLRWPLIASQRARMLGFPRQ